MLTSGGSPICTAPPASVKPFQKTPARNSEALSDYLRHGLPSFARKLPGAHHRDYHFLETEIRTCGNPRIRSRISGRSAGVSRAPRHIPEVLFHDAFLALRAGRQHGAELLRRRERGVRNAGDLARWCRDRARPCVTFALPRFAFAEALAERQLELLAALPDGVELLEPEADRIDQRVAAGAALVRSACIAMRSRLVIGLASRDRRQIGVDAGRRIGHVLAEELLADEQAARGGRRLVGLGGERQEQRLPEQSRRARSSPEKPRGRNRWPAARRRKCAPGRRWRSRMAR